MSQMKPRFKRLSLSFIILAIVAVFFQNCGQAGDITLVSAELPSTVTKENDNGAQQLPETPENPGTLPNPPAGPGPTPAPANIFKVDVSKYKNFVCEPFNTGSMPLTGVNGLKGNLAFVAPESTSDEPFVNSLNALGYWTNPSNLIHKNSTPLYFSKIDVAPMAFDAGFATGDGSYLVDHRGNRLIEWFGVKYETELGLGANDQEGYYKLASVADDGLRVEVFVDGNWVEVLDNDGIHPPRFQCQKRNSYILLKKSSRLKMRIYFFQGPRTMISNVLFFKYIGHRIPESPAVSGCELNGAEDIYSNATSSSQGQPQENYYKLKNAGWKEIPPLNFFLPEGDVNPCAINNLIMLDSDDLSYSIAGGKTVINGQIALGFLTNMESEVIAKLYDDSKTPAELVDQSIRVSVKIEEGKFANSVLFHNLMSNKTYRAEIIYRNSAQNVSNRVDYLIKPAP